MNIKDQVLLKIKLENTFKKEMTKVFNFMLMDFKLSMFKRQVFNVYDFRILWKDLLTKHYLRVQRNFRNLEGKKQLDINEVEEQNIELALMLWSTNMADKVSEEITRTNLNDVRKAMEQAVIESDKEMSIMDITLMVAVLLRRLFNSRKTTIATTETNSTAENTKLIEKSNKKERMAEAAAVTELGIKKWNTVGDDRVRDAHKAAAGQERKLNQPFDVGGELLMYPSDRSLGASIGNIANCRCSMSFK